MASPFHERAPAVSRGLQLLTPHIADVGFPSEHLAIRTAGWVSLGAVLLWITRAIWPALFIPWWFNTDELVFYYEVIRQLRLDPSQTFFDIPGTPFMTLTSLLTALWWSGECLVGLTTAATPSDFAFEHAQGVFTLMRSLTLGMYVVVVCLAYDLFRRSAGTLSGLLAAFLLATLPVHVHYGHFVRTESLGLLLCLSAIWLVLYSRRCGRPGAYGIAGLLAGVAMGARYHFALVGLPVLLAILFLHDRNNLNRVREVRNQRLLNSVALALAFLFIAGGIITVLFEAKLIPAGPLTHTMLLSTPAEEAAYAGAKQTIAKLWLLLASGLLVVLLLHSFPRARTWTRPIVNPFTLLLLLGFATGFLFSHPNFLWRGADQLRSIQFYSDWTDPALEALGPLRRWWNVSTYYFTTALPERWLQASFLGGVLLSAWRRHPIHLAYLAVAALCFVAHPLTMKVWPHHVIPWLPFLCFVAALPASWLGSLIPWRMRRPAIAAVLVLAVSASAVWGVSRRFDRANEYLKVSRARTEQISQMSYWLAEHVPADAYLLVSYFSLNDDGFFTWMENAGVPVPDFVKKRRNVRIWWLDRSSVDGHSGFVCVSRADIFFFRDDTERRTPSSTYNPFEDRRFKQVATFGGGFYELQVFKFDFRSTGVS
jgi:Dolichyl-phosphate-mannose-protein mannosyltransferase